MPRKSAAALSVVAATKIDGRPKAPDDITDEQKVVWDSVTASEPADFFKTSAVRELLKDYCRHVVTALVLTRRIELQMDREALEATGTKALSMREMDCLLKMRDRETKAVGDKATKLRLTNQSRYNTRAAANAGAKVNKESKPWDA
jgi:hypothetical protein